MYVNTVMLSGKKGKQDKEQGSPQDHEAPLLLSSVSVCPQLRYSIQFWHLS